jgi:phage FluMu protein Com
MSAVDGNAAGATLLDAYGADMTAASATCGKCGKRAALAEAAAYIRAPGVVLRCRHCAAVLLIVVSRRGVSCVDSRGAVIELGSSR